MEYKEIEEVEKFIESKENIDSGKNEIVERSKELFKEELNVMKAIKNTLTELDSSFKEIFEEEEKLREKDEREIFWGKDNEEDIKNYRYFSEINEILKNNLWYRVFNEDLILLIKQYPRMAYEKSNYLKAFYKGLKQFKNDKQPTHQFKTAKDLTQNTYYRGRYFDNESPYELNPTGSFMELTQPPKHIRVKGRFNEENQSRFYLVNSKLGVYLESEKFKKSNKNRDLYIQEFKLKELTDKKLEDDIFTFFKGFELKFSPIRDDEIGKCFEKIEDIVLKEKSTEMYEKNLEVYSVTNYIADMVNSLDFKGIEFTGTKLNSLCWYSKFTLNDSKMYRNLIVFSDGWTMYNVEKNMTKYELEAYKEYLKYFKDKIFYASDYFEPVKNYPEKIVIEDVIEEFNELLFLEDSKFKIFSPLNRDIYKFIFDFKKLVQESKGELNNFINVKIDVEDVDITDFAFLREYEQEVNEKPELFIEKFDFDNNKEQFYKYLKRHTSNINGREYDYEYEFKEVKDFKFYLSKDINNKIKLEKIEFSEKTKREIITDYLNLFHRLFGVYYNIKIDENFENIKLIKF